jgi:hypothetical protein
MTVLIVGEAERAVLRRLRDEAAKHSVHIPTLAEALKTAQGNRRHRAQMTAQTVPIPATFTVTFSIETGHGAGTCRHMSMSVMKASRLPHPEALWVVAKELGFAGGLEACVVWPEELSDGGTAINMVQPISVASAVTETK